jgi:hypothetical protein
MIPIPGLGLLTAIPLRVWLVAGAAAAAVSAGALWLHTDRAQHFAAGEAARQVKWTAADKVQAADALQRAIANAQEGKRRLERQQENQLAQDAQLAVARADAARAADARGRMQQRANAIAAAAGCAGSGDSALACVRAAAAQVADALGRCAARVQQLALDADDARAAGLKCEADYDALTPPPTERTSP